MVEIQFPHDSTGERLRIGDEVMFYAHGDFMYRAVKGMIYEMALMENGWFIFVEVGRNAYIKRPESVTIMH